MNNSDKRIFEKKLLNKYDRYFNNIFTPLHI